MTNQALRDDHNRYRILVQAREFFAQQIMLAGLGDGIHENALAPLGQRFRDGDFDHDVVVLLNDPMRRGNLVYNLGGGKTVKVSLIMPSKVYTLKPLHPSSPFYDPNAKEPVCYITKYQFLPTKGPEPIMEPYLVPDAAGPSPRTQLASTTQHYDPIPGPSVTKMPNGTIRSQSASGDNMKQLQDLMEEASVDRASTASAPR